jgi:hypothetical protein
MSELPPRYHFAHQPPNRSQDLSRLSQFLQAQAGLLREIRDLQRRQLENIEAQTAALNALASALKKPAGSSTRSRGKTKEPTAEQKQNQ